MKLALLFMVLVIPGCISDIVFGYSDAEIQALTNVYKEKVSLEIQKEQKTPLKVPNVELEKEYVATETILDLDLDNAICFATTGKLLSTHKQYGKWRPRQEYYAFSDVIEGEQIIPAGNRVFLAQVENVYRFAIDLTTVEHDWDPQLTAAISFVYNNNRIARSRSHSFDAQLSAGATQRLPFGGEANIDINFNQINIVQPDNDKNNSLTVTGGARQPLLREFGYARAHEDLVQAKRNLIFQVRNFELFRQDFTIDVIQRYYDVIRLRQVVKNNQKAYEQALFALEQTEALYQKLGEKSAIDVLRAEFGEQQAKDALNTAQEFYEVALDDFKVFLGLSPSASILLKDEQPQEKVFDEDLRSSQKVAIANRLDLRNEWEQIEDSARNIQFLRQDLLPSMDVFFNFTLADAASNSIDELRLSMENLTAGLTLEIPLDRIREKNALRVAMIAFKQQIRNFLTNLDNVRRDIQNGFRALQRLSGSLANQGRQIVIARKKERKSFLDFKEGQTSNRDLVEAQEELRDAENDYIQTKVDYEIARIQLLRDIGILHLDKYGIIKE